MQKSLVTSRFIFRNEVYFRWGGGTVVVWLQNAAGFARWGPTDDRVEALLDAWRPRSKLRSPVPPAHPDAELPPQAPLVPSQAQAHAPLQQQAHLHPPAPQSQTQPLTSAAPPDKR